MGTPVGCRWYQFRQSRLGDGRGAGPVCSVSLWDCHLAVMRGGRASQFRAPLTPYSCPPRPQNLSLYPHRVQGEEGTDVADAV